MKSYNFLPLACVAILKQSALKYKSIDNSFDTLQIFPISRRYATYIGRLRSVMTDTAGATTSLTMVESGVVAKRNDEWRLLNGQTSIVNP